MTAKSRMQIFLICLILAAFAYSFWINTPN